MPIRLLHTSDLHLNARGSFRRFLNRIGELEWDLWLDTGDFLPNHGRSSKTGEVICPQMEKTTQLRRVQWSHWSSRLTEALKGRPAILCRGNHDFISFATHLRQFGAEAYEVTPEGFDLFGLRWSGFHQILWTGENWSGEVRREDFPPILDQAFQNPPDILVTHAPPEGILNVPHKPDYGIPGLLNRISYDPQDRIRHHFFGHLHETGGQNFHQPDINVGFHNGAGHYSIHTLEIP